MLRHRRWIALAICAMMLLTVLLSSAFIAHEAAHLHVCTGENCPVCQFIAQAEQFRQSLVLAVAAMLLLGLIRVARSAWRGPASLAVPALCTPVGRKIRLND